MQGRARGFWAGAIALSLTFVGGPIDAADHSEAPGAVADGVADLADFYAWHTDDSFVAVITYFGLREASAGPVYDADVLYTVHIDTDADNESDLDIYVRFGQNDAGDWGVQVQNLPGASQPVVGAVDSNLSGGTNVNVFAGLRDDPFFFDQQGFLETLDTGTIAFDSARDSVAGTNAMAIVLEMDLAAIGAASFQTWATTGRDNN